MVRRSDFQQIHQHWPWLLLMAVMLLSALMWIAVRELNRRLFIEHQRLIRAQQQLEEKQGQLLIERGTLLDPHRIQGLAEKQLKMHLPGPGERVLLDQHGHRILREGSSDAEAA